MTGQEICNKLIEQMNIYVNAFESGIAEVSEDHARSRKQTYHDSIVVIQDTAKFLCPEYQSEVNAHANKCRIAFDEIFERYYEL